MAAAGACQSAAQAGRARAAGPHPPPESGILHPAPQRDGWPEDAVGAGAAAAWPHPSTAVLLCCWLRGLPHSTAAAAVAAYAAPVCSWHGLHALPLPLPLLPPVWPRLLSLLPLPCSQMRLLRQRGHHVVALTRSETAHTAVPPWSDVEASSLAAALQLLAAAAAYAHSIFLCFHAVRGFEVLLYHAIHFCRPSRTPQRALQADEGVVCRQDQRFRDAYDVDSCDVIITGIFHQVRG